MRLRRESARSLLELALAVEDGGPVRLDHFCAGAEVHRLLGVDLTEVERARLRAGETVSLVFACDRCLWERRLVLRSASGSGRERTS